MTIRLIPATLALALSVLPVHAIEVNNLDGLDEIFGTYAPGGDCGREPLLAISRTGFHFAGNGKEIDSSRIDYAASYWGGRYEGIMQTFFPLMTDTGDLGPIVVTVNIGEKRGDLLVEPADTPPSDPLLVALIAAGTLSLCEGTGSAAAPAAAPVGTATALDWGNLDALVDRYPGTGAGDIELLDRGEIAAALEQLMGARFAALDERLAVVSPLRKEGQVYYLSGNAPHRGGEDQAYVLIDPARRAVQVGLWEAGKLTVFAPADGRIALPADIARRMNDSPPETALALPGTPWRVVTAPGNPPVAVAEAAGSPRISSVSAVCFGGQPMLAMVLNRPVTAQSLRVGWNFSGRVLDLQMRPGNSDGTMWQATVAGSPLPGMLMRSPGTVMMRIDGVHEGEISLQGSSAALRTALSPCMSL